jgi:hypothetical protein
MPLYLQYIFYYFLEACFIPLFNTLYSTVHANKPNPGIPLLLLGLKLCVKTSRKDVREIPPQCVKYFTPIYLPPNQLIQLIILLIATFCILDRIFRRVLFQFT